MIGRLFTIVKDFRGKSNRTISMESVALEMHAAFDFINRYKATLTITTNRFLLFDPKPRGDF